ncbi:MAG: hypothetical protein ACTSQJ_17205 [Promethearchaeota archaeon]
MLAIKLVFDACSIIYLTKINIKEKLPSLGELFISKAVIKESTADLDKFKEAKTIKSNIDKKILKLSTIKIKDQFSSKNLGKGEKEIIEICSKSGNIPVIDEQKAFNFALSIGLKPKTSEIILLDLLEKNIINYNDFKEYFYELAEIKLIKPNIIKFFKKKAKIIIENQSVKEE